MAQIKSVIYFPGRVVTLERRQDGQWADRRLTRIIHWASKYVEQNT
jgi:hypothetical protein